MMRIDFLNDNYIELHGDESFVGYALIALGPFIEQTGSRRVELEIEQAAESASTRTGFTGKHVTYVPESVVDDARG